MHNKGPEIITMSTLYFVINPLISLIFWIDLLPRHDYVTCTGYVTFLNDHFNRKKNTFLSTIPLILSVLGSGQAYGRNSGNFPEFLFLLETSNHCQQKLTYTLPLLRNLLIRAIQSRTPQAVLYYSTLFPQILVCSPVCHLCPIMECKVHKRQGAIQSSFNTLNICWMNGYSSQIFLLTNKCSNMLSCRMLY